MTWADIYSRKLVKFGKKGIVDTKDYRRKKNKRNISWSGCCMVPDKKLWNLLGISMLQAAAEPVGNGTGTISELQLGVELC